MIEINFASKHMDGEVLQGEYVGKRLSELSSEQLQTLADELRGTDRESFVLLQAYMLRSGSGQQSGESYQAGNFSDISNDDAYKILGLESDAAEEDIIKAHKRLMQRLHPDRGWQRLFSGKNKCCQRSANQLIIKMKKGSIRAFFCACDKVNITSEPLVRFQH